MNDEALWLDRCRDGERDAFAFLYEKYVKSVYDFIYFKTYNKENAEELTSNTFMKAFGAIKDFDPGKGKLVSWLYRIASNEISDFFRKRHSSVSIEDVWDLSSDENVEVDFINREQLKQVQVYLGKLPKEKRDILMMRIWQDMPFAEIASVLEQNEARCKMVFYRTIDQLKKEVPATFFVLMLLGKHILR